MTVQQAAMLAERTPEKNARAIKLFFEACNKWGLNTEAMRTLLGNPSESTFKNWKRGIVRTLSQDTLDRIGTLLGIHAACRILFTNPNNIYGWISRDNANFGNRSPLQHMLGGRITDMQRVRDYLDHQRGGK